MKAYPIEFQILDDENQNEEIATLKGFDEFSVSLRVRKHLNQEEDKLIIKIEEIQ